MCRSSDSGLPGGSTIVTIDEEDESTDENEAIAPSRVRVAASPVVVEIPAAVSSADVGENEEMVLLNEDSTPQPAAAVVRRLSPVKQATLVGKRVEEEVDDEDDDDDW